MIHDFKEVTDRLQEIEIRPGIVTKDASGNLQCKPIFSRFASTFSESSL